MALPTRPVPPWARVVMYFFSDQKEISCDFWLKPQTPPAGGWDIGQFAANITSHLQGIFTPIMSLECILRGGYVEYDNGSSTIGIDKYVTVQGDLSEDAIPFDCAAVVRKFSTEGGRSGQGRWYVPGLGNSLVVGSYLSPAGVTAMNAFATQVSANFTDQTIVWKPYHWSRKTQQFSAITFCSATALLGTRRRRRGPF